jgi:hypothetical protein
MPVEVEGVRCQRCLAANSLDREFCARCGTPLMLVIASPAHRYEDEAMPELHGEHLLERISALENALARVTIIAEQALTLALQQTVASSAERLKLIESIDQESQDAFDSVASSRETRMKNAIGHKKCSAEPKNKTKMTRRVAVKNKVRRS